MDWVSGLLRSEAPAWQSRKEGLEEPEETANLSSSLLRQEDAEKPRPPLAFVIKELGFGWAQVLVILTYGGMWVADAAELTIITGGGKAVKEEFQLTALRSSSFMTVVFCGVMLGSWCGGNLGDLYGRRLPILCCYSGTVLFSLASCLSWSYNSLLSLRFFVGVSIGMGQPVLSAMVTELTPAAYRIVGTGTVSMLFSTGGFLGGLFIYLNDPSMENLDWRMLAALSAIPSLLFGLAAYWFAPESPYFLATTGRQAEAVQVMKNVRAMNRVAESDVSVQFEPPEEVVAPSLQHQLGVVFSWAFIPITVAMCFISFAFNFNVYGGLYAFAQILPEGSSKDGMTPALQLLIGSCLEGAGVVAAMLVGFYISRRVAIAIGFGIALVSSAMLAAALTTSSYLFVLGFCGMRTSSSLPVVVAVLWFSECYPSDARSTGIGLCLFCGRIGSIIVPPFFELCDNVGGYRLFMWLLSVMNAATLIVVALMPTPAIMDVDRCLGKSSGNREYGAVA